jgi:hypothetical protein
VMAGTGAQIESQSASVNRSIVGSVTAVVGSGTEVIA